VDELLYGPTPPDDHQVKPAPVATAKAAKPLPDAVIKKGLSLLRQYRQEKASLAKPSNKQKAAARAAA
jgi:hypothetical protein